MKTPDEIKKGLEGLKFIANAGRIDDAIALIQQLEAQNAEKAEKIKQLEAERDAAVNESVGTCQVCRWEDTEKCASCHFNPVAWNAYESNWQWRGVQKEETP